MLCSPSFSLVPNLPLCCFAQYGPICLPLLVAPCSPGVRQVWPCRSALVYFMISSNDVSQRISQIASLSFNDTWLLQCYNYRYHVSKKIKLFSSILSITPWNKWNFNPKFMDVVLRFRDVRWLVPVAKQKSVAQAVWPQGCFVTSQPQAHCSRVFVQLSLKIRSSLRAGGAFSSPLRPQWLARDLHGEGVQ